MPTQNRLKEYAALLRIRHKAFQRDAWLAGGLLFLALVGDYVYGALYPQVFQSSLFLVLPVIVALGAAYATVLARLQVVNASLEMIDALEASRET